MKCISLAILATALVVLTTSNASAQYAQAVLADDPFAYFRLQEPNAQHVDTAVNSSTRAGAVDGTYLRNSGVNGSFVDIPSIGAGNDPAKQFNRANGSQGAFLNSNQPATLGALSEFTISTLIRPEDYSTAGTIDAIYATDNFSAGAVHFNLVPNGAGNAQLELAVSGNNAPFPRIDLQSLVGLEEWAHIAVTYEADMLNNQNTTSFYVNGDLIDAIVTTGDALGDFDTTGNIGSWNGNSRAFQGGLDEFAFFDTALSASQIQAQASALVPEPTSIALWTMLALAGLGYGVWQRRKG